MTVNSRLPLLQQNAFYIFLAWLGVNGFFLWHNGMVLEGEAPKYIREAENLLSTGSVSSDNFWLYSTLIFLIAAIKKLSLGYGVVIAIQLLINLAACLSLYKLAATLFSKPTALFCALFFVLMYPLQELNTFLQTESLFYSFTVIFSSWLLRMTRLTAINLIGVILSLGIISVTRPTGILFVPPAFLYIFFRFFRQLPSPVKLISAAAVTILFLLIINLAMGSGGELDFMLPFRTEQIICGVPRIQDTNQLDLYEKGNSLYGLFYYVFNNFSHFTGLAWQKTIAFFGLTRSYYSSLHNTILLVIFLPLYVLIPFGINHWRKNAPLHLLYLASCVLINWFAVMLTCDDWHNRFFFTVAPCILLLGLPVIEKIFAKKKSI